MIQARTCTKNGARKRCGRVEKDVHDYVMFMVVGLYFMILKCNCSAKHNSCKLAS